MMNAVLHASENAESPNLIDVRSEENFVFCDTHQNKKRFCVVCGFVAIQNSFLSGTSKRLYYYMCTRTRKASQIYECTTSNKPVSNIFFVDM